MIGLDTNVLLRAITRDSLAESEAAVALLASLTPEHPGIVNSIILAELAWTLRTGYGYERLEIVGIVDTLLQSPAYLFTDRQAVNEAVSRCQAEPMHLADALIGEINRNAGGKTTMTFDSQAAKSTNFTLVMITS